VTKREGRQVLARIGLCGLAGILALASSAGAAVPGSPYATSVLVDDPVVYYGFDEISGTLAADAYGGVGYTLGQTAAYSSLGTANAFPGMDGPWGEGNNGIPSIITVR
jgi:hypothetical protein